ncbi:RipA family octameric membrane protein [Desulfogranum marinum]|uniref:RipA family octameric membrane protein n=1 Tax=Desulfogranum marinum TaxID=453220 RepID=UPI003F69CDCD
MFFWGFIASAFVGYASVVLHKPALAVVIACFGFVCSVAWSLVNRGSKYWQSSSVLFFQFL